MLIKFYPLVHWNRGFIQFSSLRIGWHTASNKEGKMVVLGPLGAIY